jgi:chemotaxis response regulator CheB
MGETGIPPLRLLLYASETLDGDALHRLKRQGIEVAGQNRYEDADFIDFANIDVVLVELGRETVREKVAGLLEQAQRPVLLHSGAVTVNTLLDGDLVRRLRELATKGVDRSSVSNWVVALCASVGGPKAIARFLSAVPVGLGVVFLVVQHMAKEFQCLLAAQLARETGYKVEVIMPGTRLSRDVVWIVPADRRIMVSHNMIDLAKEEWVKPNRPSMDEVLSMLAEEYGEHCGAIVFSGVGADGLDGCRSVIERGGFVWAQEPESCVVSSLPDAVRQAGIVELSDTPEALAAALHRRCSIEGRATS